MDKGLNLDSTRTGRCGRKRKLLPEPTEKSNNWLFKTKENLVIVLQVNCKQITLVFLE
jgi:hypothetical protein